MISIWFRYDFDMTNFVIFVWFWGASIFWIWFRYVFLNNFGMPSNFWYDFAMVLGGYLLVGLGCFAVSSAGSCLRMGMEAIRRNTGRLEADTFRLGHRLANDISDSKLWLRKKNFLTVAGQKFTPAWSLARTEPFSKPGSRFDLTKKSGLRACMLSQNRSLETKRMKAWAPSLQLCTVSWLKPWFWFFQCFLSLITSLLFGSVLNKSFSEHVTRF